MYLIGKYSTDNTKISFRADDIMPEDVLRICVHLRMIKCKVNILNGTKHTDYEKRTQLIRTSHNATKKLSELVITTKYNKLRRRNIAQAHFPTLLDFEESY